MSIIAKLPDQLAQMIAAGEVVERPASVVKELVENAIDAKARHISVEIKNGGMTYIRVTDDGTGIAPDDVRTAFLNHATSKVYTADQIFSVKTLGFRGEALPSIAAVSRTELITRVKSQTSGVRICMEGGSEVSFEDVGCPVGTTVVVRDLFFNVPARAKFLKKDTTEAANAESVVITAAMSHPEVAFTFIKDSRESFRAPGDRKLSSVLRTYCGPEIVSRLCRFGSDQKLALVEGFLSLPDLSRGNRNMQAFFVNGRPVRSRTLTAAMDEVYKGKLMHGRYPIYFINLTMSPTLVDVNVHPSKLEVKFAYEKEMFSQIYHAASVVVVQAVRFATSDVDLSEDHVTKEQQVLPYQRAPQQPPEPKAPGMKPRPQYTTTSDFYGKALSTVSEGGAGIRYQTNRTADNPLKPPFSTQDKPLPPAKPVGFTYTTKSTLAQNNTADDASAAAAAPSPQPRQRRMANNSFTYFGAGSGATQASPAEVRQDAPPPAADDESAAAPRTAQTDVPAAAGDTPQVHVLGELFRTYLVAEADQGVYLIDKHAARERQIYNRLCAEDGGMEGQLLLESLQVRLSPGEKAACIEHIDELRQIGFELEDFGAGGLLVRQIPMYLANADVTAVLSEAAALLSDRRALRESVRDALLKSVACKAAIKAGMSSDPQELQIFAEQVLADPEVRNCPHGRPAVVFLEKQQLEKLFKRIV